MPHLPVPRKIMFVITPLFSPLHSSSKLGSALGLTKRFIRKAIICFLLLCSSAAGLKAQYPARNVIWDNKLKLEVGFLCDSLCGGRASGTKGNVEAAWWIMRKFEKAGLMRFGDSYAKHFYAGKGTIGHNIAAFFPGSKKNDSDRYIVVGAHYDNLGTIGSRMFPGADSNASGVVAMVSLAEMLSVTKLIGRAYGCNVIFVAFDAKEFSHAGSYAFWRQIEEGELVNPVSGKTITPDKIRLMVNLEQLGGTLSRLMSGREDFLIALDGGSLGKDAKSLIERCNISYRINLELSDSYYGSDSFSQLFYNKIGEQKVFVEHKIPSVMFTSGITMNNNKTIDTPESLDYSVLRQRIYLIWHWLEYQMW